MIRENMIPHSSIARGANLLTKHTKPDDLLQVREKESASENQTNRLLKKSHKRINELGYHVGSFEG